VLRDTLGMGVGDHLAMVMGNRVEFIEIAVAALLAGTWVTPVNWHLTADEIAFIVGDAHARALVVDPAFEAVARDAVDRAATGATVIVAGDELDALVAAAADQPFDLDGPAGATCSTRRARPGDRRASNERRGNDRCAAPSDPRRGPAARLDGGVPTSSRGPCTTPRRWASPPWTCTRARRCC